MESLPLTKQQYVYHVLRDEIQAGKLRPGDRLALGSLAERFGISQIPVREAIRQLEQEGLVETTPHVKATVKGVTFHEAVWAAELRLVLEPIAAREATPYVTKQVLDELEVLVRAMGECMAEDEFEGYMRSNRVFHETIYRAAPNETLLRMISELWDTAQRFRNLYRQPSHLGASQDDHVKILAALRKGDPSGVENVVRLHRQRNLELLRDWRAAEEPSATE